ncbi:hypothetical protein AB0I89_06180 [Micromonospora sp. NPDC049801]|uniref:hypothetical protein n=1 Tax=unclassified Micromonospora TaxID=2617518 RepID=UPI0033D9DAEB
MSDLYNEWDYYNQDGSYANAYSGRNSPTAAGSNNYAQYAQSPGAGSDPNLAGYRSGDVVSYDRLSVDTQYVDSGSQYVDSGSQGYAQYAAAPTPYRIDPVPREQLLFSQTDGRTVNDFYPNIDYNYRLMGEGNSPTSPVAERSGLDLDRNHSEYRGLEAGFIAALEGRPVSIVSTGDGKVGVVPAPEPGSYQPSLQDGGSSLGVGEASQPGSYQPSLQNADSDASIRGLAPSDQYQISETPDRRSHDQSSVVRIDAAGRRHWATWEQAALLGAAVGLTGEALARALVAPAGVVAAVAATSAPDVVHGLWNAKAEFVKYQNGQKPNWDRALSGLSKAIAYGATAGIPAQMYRAYQPGAGDSNQVVFNRAEMRLAAIPASIAAGGAFAALVFDKRARAQQEKETGVNQHHGFAGLESQSAEGRDRGREDNPGLHRRKGKEKVKAAAQGS